MRGKILVLVAVGILCVNYAIFQYNLFVLGKNRDWVTHTNEVLTHLHVLHGALRTAQAAERGYLLSGSEAERVDFEHASSNLRTGADKLVEMVSDNPQQNDQAQEVRRRLHMLLDHLDKLIQHRSSRQSSEEWSDLIFACRTLTAKVFEAGVRFQKTEQELQASRIKDMEASWSRLATTIHIASAACLLVVGVAYCLAERHSRNQTDRHDEVVRHNDDLLETEKQLREAKEQAEKANAAKDQLLAILGHEMRTPLTPCLMVASSMAMDMTIPEDLRKAFANIQRNLELEARLIDDLFNVVLINKGKMSLHMTVIDAHHKIELAADICRPDLVDKRISVEMQLEALQHHLTADAARFQQVVWNLIKNAIKFTLTGGKITIRTCNKGEDFVLEVIDNGIGIKAEIMPTIFEAFSQGERDKGRKYGGLGLGLSISREIVVGHKGTLEAFSDGEGRGSRFVVTLPTTYIPPLPPPSFEEKSPCQNGDNENKCHIFYVEDDEPTREIMCKLLQGHGYEVTLAASLGEALKINPSHFDVLVSDIGLGDGTGLELMRRIRADGCDLPGLALSGYGTEEDEQNSLAVGFAEHLTKPLAFPSLDAAIRRVARRR